MTPETVVGLFAEPVRLRVFSAIALGARTLPAVSRTAGTSAKETAVAVRRLISAGIVEESADGGLGTRPELFREIVRRARPADEGAERHGYEDQRIESLLRTFVRGGRLTGVPAQFDRRRIVLQHLVRGSFEADRTYTEKEVNALLRQWCQGAPTDHVTVRRYLVDYCLLGRDDRGRYWLRELAKEELVYGEKHYRPEAGG
ncbi:DUF2087 domain-containing protein [Streptomyces sp. NPDC088923]|uniref:DUF2087 domain-containing protein n=1 Tax=Streptomyces sp. NPDC088923 TaxID=3365913 RepID=UPI0037F965ED